MDDDWMRDWGKLNDIAFSVCGGQPPGTCPICMIGELRFYYHAFKSKLGLQPRCALWVWCPHCRRGGIAHGIAAMSWWEWADPLDEVQLRELERDPPLTKHLNKMWEENSIRHDVPINPAKLSNREHSA